jgi:folylpolyglutamate synthase
VCTAPPQEVAASSGARLLRPPPLDRYRLAHVSPNAPPAATAPADGAPESLLSAQQAQPGQLLGQQPGIEDGARGVVGLGGEHMRLNAALAIALAAEWETQYGAAVAAAGTAAAAGGQPAAAAAAAVQVAAGRPVSLAPGGPEGPAATARAVAVRSALTLPEEYARGLRTVRWPGRSQVSTPGPSAVL